MATAGAPKQWALTKQESITSFEAWRYNLIYRLSLDKNFADFLVEGTTWLKKSSTFPLRGFTDDGEDVAEVNRRSAAQKVTHLERMLDQIANYCPVISRNTINRNSTSINSVWQAIRMHYGLQSTGGHFLDFNNIRLEPGERPEDLFQRLSSFVEDNLLKSDRDIKHHGEVPANDEELSPSLENVIVLTWLRLIHSDLPALVKQRYGTELRSQTIASLKPEISQAMGSLLDEIHSSVESKVLRTAFRTQNNNKSRSYSQNNRQTVRSPNKTCVLCQQAGRPNFQHFLSSCKFLPEGDKQYMTRARQTTNIDADYDDAEIQDDDNYDTNFDHLSMQDNSHASARRVGTKQSPHMKVFYKHHPIKVTLDTGAEISMIKLSVAEYIGASITKSSQNALQADGITPLQIIGETHITLVRDGIELLLEALVVNDLDVDILAGIPFMSVNDISVRPSKHQISIRDSHVILYGQTVRLSSNHRVRRTQAHVLRASPISTVIWPGSFVEVKLPDDIDPESTLAIEPRLDRTYPNEEWPRPNIIEAVGGTIRVYNHTHEPQPLRKNEHFCQVHLTTEEIQPLNDGIDIEIDKVKPTPVSTHTSYYSDTVKLDPDNILPEDSRMDFVKLLNKYDDVFDPNIKCYNGAAGKFEMNINMGPVQPPQRKGRVPQYSRDKLVELQQKFDNLETLGVFCKPESVGITAEYLNPSFLVKKPNGTFRLVTAFEDVGRYSKPQPSLMPDVDSTLRSIAQWKYIIVSDLTSAFYQIPISKSSMKYCGVASPFRGVRVYTRCAMGMPGSETALEELMCRVLGDCLQEGFVAKLADDLYCGGDTPEQLMLNWSKVLESLHKCDLRLSPAKTIICPRSTTILGWIWNQGKISASPHRIAVLSSCKPPETVFGMRSFIGAYKVLGRVLPHCSHIIAPLDDAIAGLQSKDKINWSEELSRTFSNAQTSLSTNLAITLPKPSDQVWIVTDGSVSKHGIGATLYVMRNNNRLLLAGFYSAKLRKHQVTWLPCEIEGLCIAAAVKHFSPYIIQSQHQTCVLTDSQPCVQAINKLARGEFSASPRVTSFLSVVSRYQVNVRHLAGSVNIPSDFASRNAPDCNNVQCQICKFIIEIEDSVVRSVSIQDVIDKMTHLPFTTRTAWINIQSDCMDLRRTHAHLKQGTRPSKKVTNIKDVKRYLNVASIARDGLLVVRQQEPMKPTNDLIIVPRSVLDGLATALHIKLNHPTKYQLQLVMKRNFFALDINNAINRACESCHTCASLQKFPKTLICQSSGDPPETVGVSFAADVIKRNRQLILVLRESATSYTSACFISDEKHETLRDGLLSLAISLHPLDGPPAIIRVDPAPGFMSLRDNDLLKQFRIVLEIGRIKNTNKNPVAEKAIGELEEELLRQEPGGGIVSELGLTIAVSRLNSRIRGCGLSSRELWTQRNQYTHDQIPIIDRDIILEKHHTRVTNHPSSERSKSKSGKVHKSASVCVGDLIYLYGDRDKSKARCRYIVVSIDGQWCFIKKFTGNQLRSTSYKVKLNECYHIPSDISKRESHSTVLDSDSDNEECLSNIPRSLTPSTQPTPPEIPPLLSLPDLDYADNITSQVTDFPNDVNAGIDEDLQESTGDCNSLTTSNDSDTSNVRPKRTRKPPEYLKDYVT